VKEIAMRTLAVALIALPLATLAFAAGTEADFKTAFAAADAAEKQAAALKNRWSTTEQALAAAKKAAAANDFDTAVKQAQHAEALAKASIAQAKEQQDAWKAAVIR
jgi:hypothetical protein